jgi:glycolate oxidase iron-sulfur subunit
LLPAAGAVKFHNNCSGLNFTRPFVRTDIPDSQRADAAVREAEAVIRTCVHCGFCNATCPTYQLTGSELEGPRGRIYLMKSVLEGRVAPSSSTLDHIDNCLGCLACETTCPSGVEYSRLLDDGRPRLDRLRRRPLLDWLQRCLLAHLLPHPGRFRMAMRLATWTRPLGRRLPGRLGQLAAKVPDRLPPPARRSQHGRHPAAGPTRLRVALLTGCAQSVLGPSINDAAVRLLNRRGADVVIPTEAGCCGALTYHMGERRSSRRLMARNVDVWHRLLSDGAIDAVVLTTSGCATAVRDYGHIFAGQPDRAEAAAAVSARVRDISEVIDDLGLGDLAGEVPRLRLAYHDACSMQHGLRVQDAPRRLLGEAGFEVVEIPEGHLCCGSAGTYNLLRPHLAQPLQQRKADHIRRLAPDAVAAGNIGCIEQIAAVIEPPVVHTVELLDWATGGPPPHGLIPKRSQEP